MHFTFFIDVNTKIGRETKSIIPNILIITSEKDNSKILLTDNRIVAAPIKIRLIDHKIFTLFSLTFSPPQKVTCLNAHIKKKRRNYCSNELSSEADYKARTRQFRQKFLHAWQGGVLPAGDKAVAGIHI